jgi:hypothetical protein
MSGVRVLVVIVAALAGAACFKFGSEAAPSSSASTTLGGTWASVESFPGVSGSLADSCTNFQWAVTQFNGTSGSGTFSAVCLGNLQVGGSAQGTINGSTIAWSANATAALQGQPPCNIALSGTAVIETDRVRIPYAGTTCLGPVSGTEVIKR